MKITNYIKISLRTLFLHRVFSLITLLGLSVGIAMSIFVLEYVFYQFSFDQHYSNSSSIYRVVTRGQLGNDKVNAALSPMILNSVLRNQSGVKASTRIVDASEKPVQSRYAKTYESNIVYVDSTFFSVFSRPFIAGAAHDCLRDSSTVAVSQSAAQRLFDTHSPIGEFIHVNEVDSFKIGGVFKDVPDNSHFRYDVVLPFKSVEKQLINYYGDNYQRIRNSWYSLTCYTYFKTQSGIDIDTVASDFKASITPLIEAESDDILSSPSSVADVHYHFQPLETIYLFSDLDFEIGITTNPLYVFVFLGVAIFIFLVTAFNFMNLSTARAPDRAKEAGVRSILGAHRKSLIFQFISESVLFSFIALFFGLVLIELLQPLFNRLFHMSFFASGHRQQLDLAWIFVVTLIVGILSGSYPAYVFSGFRAADLQKGHSKFTSSPGLWFRGFLVMIQVFMAVMVTTTSIGMWRQLWHVEQTDHGFNTDNLVLVEGASYLGEDEEWIVNKIEKTSGVKNVSRIYNDFGESVSVMSFNYPPAREKIFLLSVYYVDCSFFKTLEARVTDGQFDCSDSANVVINRQAAGLLGDKALGNHLQMITQRTGYARDLQITGVVDDIHTNSLKQSLRPAVYIPAPEKEVPAVFAVRYSADSKNHVVSEIQHIWDESNTGVPFSISTVDDRIEEFYREDYRYSSLATAFSLLVIVISLLGMTGLASFLLATRRQEAFLRKITGIPDGFNIKNLFLGYFIFITLGACLALPTAMYLLKVWSGTFTVQYETDFVCFIVPFLLVLSTAAGIAWFGAKRMLKSLSLHQF